MNRETFPDSILLDSYSKSTEKDYYKNMNKAKDTKMEVKNKVEDSIALLILECEICLLQVPTNRSAAASTTSGLTARVCRSSI